MITSILRAIDMHILVVGPTMKLARAYVEKHGHEKGTELGIIEPHTCNTLLHRLNSSDARRLYGEEALVLLTPGWQRDWSSQDLMDEIRRRELRHVEKE